MSATTVTPRRIRLSRAKGSRTVRTCRFCQERATAPSQLGFCSAQCRFWSKVDQGGGDECWRWKGPPHTAKGYGHVDIDGKRWMAHRYAYAFTHRVIPSGFEVHHRCENTMCVNPAHLRALSPEDHAKVTNQGAYQRLKTTCPQGHPYDDANTRVSATGGRCCRACEGYHGEGTKGTRNGSAKLTDALVLEARRRRAAGELVADLARHYGVSKATMSRVTTGAGWSHVA